MDCFFLVSLAGWECGFWHKTYPDLCALCVFVVQLYGLAAIVQRNPPAALCAAYDRLDNPHVRDGILDWGWYGGVVENCLGEEITLDGVLIAGVEGDRFSCI